MRVFQKEGHLNEESIPTFQKLFAFDERRAEYFRILHRFCKSKSPDDQREHFQRLMELREMDARKPYTYIVFAAPHSYKTLLAFRGGQHHLPTSGWMTYNSSAANQVQYGPN